MTEPTVPAYDTPEWREWRRTGIGASDLPAIFRVDPYTTEYELALEKRGAAPLRAETTAMRWGRAIEPLALTMYAEITGRRVTADQRTRTNPNWPRMFAHLDGAVVDEPVGLEVKWTRRWHGNPPRRVEIQVQAGLAITGLDAMDVIQVGPYGDPNITTIERNDRLGDMLMAAGEAWYERYVLGDELPPLDGSRGASRYLDETPGEGVMDATIDQHAMAVTLAKLRAAIKTAEERDAVLVNRLKESMVGSVGVRGDGWSISWRQSKPAHRTNWEAVADAYRKLLLAQVDGEAFASLSEAERDIARRLYPADLDTIIGIHTTIGDGARPFRFTTKGNE